MRIIISPTKQMRESEALDPCDTPALLPQARQVLDWMQRLSYEQAKELWGCSEKLAIDAFYITRGADLDKTGTPAILAYDGIAYKYMAPDVFENGQFDYVQENLRIISGLYGALRPLDGIVPYRLEMQHKAQVGGAKDLYDFWGRSIYEQVMTGNEDRTVINLASKEYSRCIERFLTPQDTFVTCTFAQDNAGKLVQKGVWCKMARGEMVRYMATANVRAPEQLKDFDSPTWRFDQARSTDTEYLFIHRG